MRASYPEERVVVAVEPPAASVESGLRRPVVESPGHAHQREGVAGGELLSVCEGPG